MPRKLAVSVIAAFAGMQPVLAGPSDWTYTVLNSPGQSSAIAYGIGGGVAVGYQGGATLPRATIWPTLSSSGAVSLHPAGATESNIVGTTGTQHVGNVVMGGIRRAGLWNGASFTSLHLTGYAQTYAQGTDGVQQSGLGTTAAGEDRALLWSGTAASAVVLNPAGSVGAAAYAIGGGRQVGWAEFAPSFGTTVAGFWSGTATSWTPLGAPPEFGSSSVAVAISPDGGTQAGYVVGRTGTNWAALWHSTPGSFTSLQPAGAFSSSVIGADNRFQAGWAITASGAGVAALWEGSAASFTDLGALLPPMYSVSRAYGVYSTGTDVWVTGYAYIPATDSNDAIVWHRTIPTPGSLAAGVLGPAALLRRRRAAVTAWTSGRAPEEPGTSGA